jgi:hypothetical protein
MLHQNDNLQDKAKIPDYCACPVNVRKVNTTLLGEKCIKDNKGLVNLLRKEKKDTSPSILTTGGIFNFIFTSYDVTSENPCAVMHSTLNEEVSCF